MTETLTPQATQEQKRSHEQLLNGEAARLLGALVLKAITDESFRNAILEAHEAHMRTAETTEQTTREYWRQILQNFPTTESTPKFDDTKPPFQTPLYEQGAFLGSDYWSDGSSRYTYDDQGNRTEHDRGTFWDGKYTKRGKSDKKRRPNWDGDETDPIDDEGEAQAKPQNGKTQTASSTSGPSMPFFYHPTGRQPNETESAAAARANELMREGLKAQGWEGGVPTEEQFKKATRTTLRDLHTDSGERSDVDQEAAKIISGQTNDIRNEYYSKPAESAPKAEAKAEEPPSRPSEPTASSGPSSDDYAQAA